MKKIILIFFLSIAFLNLYCQTQKKFSHYFLAQYNGTISDITKGNNPWGVGIGLQTIYNTKFIIRPTLELAGDVYLLDNKVLRFYETTYSSPINTVGSMVNLFGGIIIQPTKNMLVSFLAGPSFISGQTLVGIKPSVDFFLSENKKWLPKFSYINFFIDL